jgi:hypothetical protein
MLGFARSVDLLFHHWLDSPEVQILALVVCLIMASVMYLIMPRSGAKLATSGQHEGNFDAAFTSGQLLGHKSPQSAELVRLLRTFYTEAEAFQYLMAPQPQFDGAIAMDMIALGRMDELILSLRRFEQGIYL